jgi:hypothetical protein
MPPRLYKNSVRIKGSKAAHISAAVKPIFRCQEKWKSSKIRRTVLSSRFRTDVLSAVSRRKYFVVCEVARLGLRIASESRSEILAIHLSPGSRRLKDTYLSTRWNSLRRVCLRSLWARERLKQRSVYGWLTTEPFSRDHVVRGFTGDNRLLALSARLLLGLDFLFGMGKSSEVELWADGTSLDHLCR